jgi:periplasmic divalent cation tolerance protein
MPDTLLVLTNLPDAASAERIARLLVEQRLAACVNILAPCTSVYRWNAAIETAAEVPLLIKTTRARYAELEAARRGPPLRTSRDHRGPSEAGLPATWPGWRRNHPPQA